MREEGESFVIGWDCYLVSVTCYQIVCELDIY